MFVSSVWSMSQSKRQNFTLLEKSALAECIIKYKHIIENKATDAVTNKQKHDAWNSIAEEFNRIPGVTSRTVKQLNFCYKNLKRKAKKRIAYETELSNGGCPTVTHEDDAINETLFAIGAAACPQEKVFECDNLPNVQTSDTEQGNVENDDNNLGKDNSGSASDEMIIEKAVIPAEQQPVLHIISSEKATKSSTSQASKTRKYEENSLLQKNEVDKLSRIGPTSKLLKRMRKDCTTSSVVTAALLEELKLKNEFLREEHELMIKLKKEKHDIKMEILRTDLKIKKKILSVLETDPQKINFSLNLCN